MNDNNNSNSTSTSVSDSTNNDNETNDLVPVDEADLSFANGGARTRAARSLWRGAYRWATSGEGRTYFRRGAAAGAGFETGRRIIQNAPGGGRGE